MSGIIYCDREISYHNFIADIQNVAHKISNIESDGVIVTEDDWYSYFIYAFAGLLLGKKVCLLHPQTKPQSLTKLINNNYLQIGKDSGKEVFDFSFSSTEEDREGSQNDHVEFFSLLKGSLVFKTSGTTSDLEKYTEIPFEWLYRKSASLAKLLKITCDDLGIIFSCPCFIQVFWTLLVHIITNSSVIFTEFNTELKAVLNKYQVSTVVAPAAIVRGILLPGKYNFSALKNLICGGDYMDFRTLEILKEAYPDTLYTCVYGCSEISAANVCTYPIELRNMNKSQFGIGFPQKDNDVFIAKNAHDNIGELWIRTPYTTGYYLIDNKSFLDENGFFHTGDLVYEKEDGMLVYVGRSKDIIIYNGQKIVGTEVERVLNELPDVRESVVMGVPHHIYGEIVVCFLVLNNHIEKGYIRTFLESRLESYKVPKEIYFLEELPKTHSGKIIRNNKLYKELAK